MKKQGSMMLVICIILCTMIIPTAYADQEGQPITVLVNGEQLDFDVNPMTENDRTLVPMRMIFEALGAEVTWDDETNTARAVKETLTIEITIDQMYLLKNGSKVELDVPARLVNNRTLVPIRAISEGLDAKVEWNEELKQVMITTKEEVITPTPSPSIKPSASPSPSPTPTVKPSTSPTPSPTKEPDKIYAFNELSEEDMATLKQRYNNAIRYDFEQRSLPMFMLDSKNEKSMSMEIRDKNSDLSELVKLVWNAIVVGHIVQIQVESESTYAIKSEKVTAIDQYLPLVKEAGLEGGSYFSCSFKTLKDNSVMLLITFKETDTLMACKYIGIVASPDNSMRYFTAETDLLDKENLYFCEITTEGRGTLGIMGFEEEDFCDAVEEEMK